MRSKSLKRLDEAMASYDKALALKPDYAEAFNNHGNALQELKRLTRRWRATQGAGGAARDALSLGDTHRLLR